MALLPKFIIVLGLCLDIVGVALLTYDIVYNPGRLFQIKTKKTQLKSAKWVRDSIIAMHKHLPRPPYTEEKIQTLINETNANYEKSSGELEDQVRNLEEGYPKKLFNWGLRGIMLVTIGFILQAVGTMLS